MILIHAGWHFNAVLPWLAVLLLMVVVASGFTGKFLLREARERLASREQELRLAGALSTQELEKQRFLDSLTVDLMEKWRHFAATATSSMLVLGMSAPL
jgi:hypothetical protein